jgi:sugar/nucleoside kinase (ribokinase family)
MKILTIGGATQDIFIVYEDAETMHLHTKTETLSYLLLKEGGKIEVKDILYSSGGGANNAAFSFKKQGFEVTPFLKIGKDQAGQFVLQKLAEAGIPSELVIQAAGSSTGISFIIPSLERDRTIFAFRGVNASIAKNEFPLDAIASHDYVYITSLSGESSQLLLPITQMAKKNKVFVATNPGTSQLVAGAPMLRESLPNIDVLILNSAEAKKFMLSLVQTNSSLKQSLSSTPKSKNKQQKPSLLEGPISIEDVSFNFDAFFNAVLSYGPKMVVVTNGAEGVYCATRDHIYFHASLPVKVVNTLGAGDAFGSTFVGALAAGKSIEQALRHGIINAASVISFMDTKQGLLSMQELEKREKELKADLLQKFSFKS